MILQRLFIAIWIVFWPRTTDSEIHATSVESISYPDVAWTTQIQGEVQVDVVVSAEGEVTSALASSGDSLLRMAAEDNARKWKFNFGAARRLKITYEFKLGNPKSYYKRDTKCVFDLPDRVEVISNLRTSTH